MDTKAKTLRLEKPVRITDQVWPEGTTPAVSVFCITYNHAKFIRDAIEGFLMQETTFPVQIFVHDDASTDGTAEIIQEYADRYPQMFWVVLQTENQWTLLPQTREDGHEQLPFTIAYLSKQQGEFIAVCEGDDYWTDPLKLEKQLDFLRANPDCVGCVHDAKVVDAQGRTLMESCINRRAKRYTRRDCVKWLLSGYPTASLVFRREALRELPSYLVNAPRDVTLDIAITKHGDLGVLDANMSVYREHAGGTWTNISSLHRSLHNHNMFVELLINEEICACYGDYVRAHLNAVRRKILHEAEVLTSVKRSLSWRVTKPLRAVRRMIDRCDHGSD